MGANKRLASMPDKLPNISGTNRGFHGFSNTLQAPSGSQISIDEVELKFEKKRKQEIGLPGINGGGILANQPQRSSDSRKVSRQQTFLTCVDEDEDNETVAEMTRVGSQDEQVCASCAEKLSQEGHRLQNIIDEMQLEKERQKQEFDTTKRKLDNTSKELKTSQAMIGTLKDQNQQKADKIAKLTREATIGLWNREKKKLLQFADVREASLECELTSLKDVSRDFKNRSLDRIQFLHDQVARLKLQLNVRNSNNQMNKMLETAEKKLGATKEELIKEREEFFAFRRDMVGMLAGFNSDFGHIQSQVNPETQAVDLDFFQHAEQFETMLQDLHQAAAADNLSEIVGKLPEKFSLSEAQKNELSKRRKEKSDNNLADQLSMAQDPDSLSEADILKKLETIESALHQSSKEIKDFDDNMNDINDSGISLNDYDGRSTVTSRGMSHDNMYSSSHDNPRSDKNTSSHDNPRGISHDNPRGISHDNPRGISHDDSRGDRNVRFKNSEGNINHHKKAGVMTEKSVQTEIQTSDQTNGRSPVVSRRSKRNRKSKSREKLSSREKPPTPRKKSPKKIDANARFKQDQVIQKQWLEAQQSMDRPKSKKRGSPDTKSHQNSMTFTHLRDMYSEKRMKSLIDRTTGAVDVELAASQFTNLSRAGILEGFTHFVQYDSNNDYKLDINELIRAVSRATDEVVESEEIKSALFELGVLETDELDFFDFLCIQETLTTGTFDKSKSNVLRSQIMNINQSASVSKYCAVM